VIEINEAPKSWFDVSCAMIQPPTPNSTGPKTNAKMYGGTGHVNRGFPYRQMSGSLPQT